MGTNVAFLAVRVLKPEDDETYFIHPPKGVAYWERLHQIVEQERVLEIDRYFMSNLQVIGIEKGKPFEPTEHQRSTNGAWLERDHHRHLLGDERGSFQPCSTLSQYREDTRWVHPLTLHPHHITEFTQQFEERVDWAYEAYGLSPAMKAKVPGVGSTYLGAYQDNEGE